MPDYDYGNARLHAMKSRLLSSRELDMLVNAGSLQGLISSLTKTAYQKAVEGALTRTSGMDCIEDALRSDLENTVGKTQGFYTGSARKMVAIVLRAYDIHNLKAILRGLSKTVLAGEILKSLLPIGELKYNLLRELAGLHTPREAIDALASMGQPIAWPLVTLRTERPGAQLFELELALEQWHYRDARRSLRAENRLDDALANALTLEADLSNALTALRFAKEPAERDRLRDYFSDEHIEHLFIGPGRIPFDMLAETCHRDTVAAAVETLAGTALGPALQAGLERYEQSQRLSDIEKQLKRYRLKWMAGQMVKDPLGIGMLLGYIAVKTNEVGKIRWIAHGIDLGLNAETIRDELEVIP
ncbi:MAG: V-type ATPase subunit [Chloroflexota bacterium]